MEEGRRQTLIIGGMSSKSLLVDSFERVGLRGREFCAINDAYQAAIQTHDFTEADLAP